MTIQAFLLLLIAVSMSTTGELLLKQGMNQVGVINLAPAQLMLTLFRTFTNPFVFFGFVLIFGGSIFWLAVISRSQLSLAYPMVSLGYIVVLFLSWLFLNEAVTPLRLAGVVVIICGVFLVSRS